MATPHLSLRQEEDASSLPENCAGAPIDQTNMPLRIASIFIILVGSLLGAVLPIYLHSKASNHVPRNLFFIFKFVGSGVIIGTAWMHLLSPASEALGDPCLERRLGEYDWAMAIAGMTFMSMVLVQVVVNKFGPADWEPENDIGTAERAAADEMEAMKMRQRSSSDDVEATAVGASGVLGAATQKTSMTRTTTATTTPTTTTTTTCPPPEDHLTPRSSEATGCCAGKNNNSSGQATGRHEPPPSECPSHTAFTGQLTAIFILEFGVVFHSIFIGLVLSTTDELKLLLPVLVFHQLFEGLGLGARLAVARWPSGRRGTWWPYVLAVVFALSTPVAIAAGLGATPGNHETQLLLNGIFDAVSAGILLYTGVVELVGREFLFNPHMRAARLRRQLGAYGCIAAGFGVMTLLAKWA